MSQIKFKLAVNSIATGKSDEQPGSMKDKAAWNFVNMELTKEEFMEHVKAGHSFCNWLRVDKPDEVGHRCAANFKEANSVLIDIDSGTTLADAKNDPLVSQYCAAVYTSTNHRKPKPQKSGDPLPPCDRFRLVFVLENSVTDALEYKAIVEAFIRRFGSDEACKDVSRLFYGNKEADCAAWDKLTPLNVVGEVLARYPQEAKIFSAQKQTPADQMHTDAGPGLRYATIFSMAGKSRKLGMDVEQATAAALVWNAEHAIPPHDEDYVRSIVETNYKAYGLKPEQFKPEQLPSGSVIGADGKLKTLVYEDVASLQTEPIIYTPNLVTGWMKTVGMNLLSGTEGSGKSMLAMNLSLCVCLGEEFLGRTVRQGKVLYLDNEVDKEEFKERLHRMNKQIPPDTFHILFDAPVMEARYVEAKIQEFMPSLVIVDSFYLATNAKEKDNDALKVVLGLLKGLAHKYQCVILVVTHFHKGTRYDKLHMDMTVGGGAQNRIVNGAFLMRRSDKDESQRIIKADKLRGFDDDERKPRLLSFDKNTFWFKDEGEVDEDEHTAHIGEEKMDKVDIAGIFKKAGKVDMTRDDILKIALELRYSESTVDRAIRRAIGKVISKEKWGSYQLLGADLPQLPPMGKMPEMSGEPDTLDADTPIPE